MGTGSGPGLGPALDSAVSRVGWSNVALDFGITTGINKGPGSGLDCLKGGGTWFGMALGLVFGY